MLWYDIPTLAMTKIPIFVMTRSLVLDLYNTPITNELQHQSISSNVNLILHRDWILCEDDIITLYLIGISSAWSSIHDTCQLP